MTAPYLFTLIADSKGLKTLKIMSFPTAVANSRLLMVEVETLRLLIGSLM